MALGFTLLDGLTVVRPDRGLNIKNNPRVRLATFGDGYEQRLQDGINSLKQEFQVSFINREAEEADDIVAFFEDKAGVTAFDFTIPDSNESGSELTIKVVCPDWSQVFTNKIGYGVTAKFRRVYEP